MLNVCNLGNILQSIFNVWCDIDFSKIHHLKFHKKIYTRVDILNRFLGLFSWWSQWIHTHMVGYWISIETCSVRHTVRLFLQLAIWLGPIIKAIKFYWHCLLFILFTRFCFSTISVLRNTKHCYRTETKKKGEWWAEQPDKPIISMCIRKFDKFECQYLEAIFWLCFSSFVFFFYLVLLFSWLDSLRRSVECQCVFGVNSDFICHFCWKKKKKWRII